MENKELERNALESTEQEKESLENNASEALSDDALESVSGGVYQRLLKPIILGSVSADKAAELNDNVQKKI